MRQEFDALKLILDDLLASKLRELRRHISSRLFVAVTLAALVAIGIAGSFARQGWKGVAEDLSVNIAASAIVAGTTIVSFVVGTRRRALARILKYQRREYAHRGGDPVHRLNQARAVVTQLRDRRQPGSLLIEASDASSRAAFLRELVTVLTQQSIIAIVVPGRALLDAQVGQAALEEFRRMLSLAGVPEAPLDRTLESLARRRGAVVIIDGLDESDKQATARSAADIVDARVDELRVAHLSFVAIIEPGSVPYRLLTCRLTLSPLTGAALHALVDSTSEETIKPTGSIRDALRLATFLRSGFISLQRIKDHFPVVGDSDSALRAFVSSLHADVRRYGPLTLHIQLLLDIGLLHRPEPGRKSREQSEALVTLGEIVNRMLRYDSKLLDWADLVTSVPSNQVDRLLSGVNDLENLGLVERVVQFGRINLCFLDPELRELVVGIRAARSSLPFGYTASRSMTAFSGESLQRLLTAGEHTDKVWQQVTELTTGRGWLVPVNDVACALDGIAENRSVRLNTSWLTETWERAADRERIAFIRRLPESPPEELTNFLWSRLTPPAFVTTSHPVRRVIAGQLSSSGTYSWSRLKNDWCDLVRIAGGGGLAWFERDGATWRSHGSAVASLCWVLPSITLTCRSADSPAVEQLLMDLAAAVTPGSGPEHSPAPDLGIEISLAEGCKDLCNLSLIKDKPLSAITWDLIEILALHGRSWVSHLLAIQAAALAVASDPQHTLRCIALYDTLSRSGQHPIVREYAQIITRAMASAGSSFDAIVHTVVWADDTETLESAGGELTDDAIRLLGVMTLVLNLVEARIGSGGDWQTQQLSRVSALVEPQLPKCLSSPVLANAFGRVDCVCSLRLCGPDLNPMSRRPISRVFAYRCLSPSLSQERVRPALQLALQWPAQALASHLRRVAREPSEDHT
ncbi:MAG TPA: hypothetical protein VHY21_04200 [Pseudonocardiaceae bacterium]|jgi:hypothetical protein|nr:hypothetical protein [Pseudonocardiaceae bacterium]